MLSCLAMSLPAPVKELWTFWRDIEARTMRPAQIALVAPPGARRDEWRNSIVMGSDYPERLAVSDPDAPEPLEADVALVLIDAHNAEPTGPFRALDRFPRDRLAAVVVGGDGATAPTGRRDAARALDLPESGVLYAGDVTEIAGEFARQLFGRFGNLAIPMARQFPIFRDSAAWEEIHASAKQNALVGLIPVPGGDMPIMTANQIKMVLRMAAMFDLPLNARRAREIVAVVGGGFGLRTLARQLVKLVPGPGWLVSGGLGYGGTLAMGRAALEYFRRTARSAGSASARAGDPEGRVWAGQGSGPARKHGTAGRRRNGQKREQK
jgi:uncharacterized protein (DUF697 family)